MSYALSLMVLTAPAGLTDEAWWPDCVLKLATDYHIIGQLCDLSGHAKDRESPTIETYPLPPATWVAIMEEGGEKKVRQDPYGEELRWTFSKNLRQLKVPEDALWMNKAIKAFLDQTPDEIPIVLYPH